MSGGAIMLSRGVGLINADYLMRFVELVKGWINSTTLKLNDLSDERSINSILSQKVEQRLNGIIV